MEEKKEFLVYWRDDARATFATQEEAEAFARKWAPSYGPPFTPGGACVMIVRAVRPHARVIRIVRARPSRLCDACGFLIEAESRRRAPSEASAVEVLRELVAYTDFLGGTLTRIQARARRVLAASGPDPSEVVRAAMSWSEATAANGTARTVALQLACVAYRKAGGKS